MKSIIPSGCPDDDILVAWHDGEAAMLLDSAQEQALTAHILGCAHCAARLAGLDALEADLLVLNLTDGAPDPAFTRQVLAALPVPRPASLPARPPILAGGLAWSRQQMAALTLVLMGLLIMLATGDALALLGNWWQEAGAWYDAASTTDGAGMSALMGTLPGSSTAPDAQIGLVVGAVLLALGAGVFVIRAISTQETQVAAPVPVRRTRPV